MNRALKISLLFFLCLVLNGCEKDPMSNSDFDYLVFGHFRGECFGEQCVEIYRLDRSELYEDVNDNYPVGTGYYSGLYVLLSQEKFDRVSYLKGRIPKQLLGQSDTIMGCPDCADQGGLYIEFKSPTIHHRWILDQNKRHIPEYLHDFMDELNRNIRWLSEG